MQHCCDIVLYSLEVNSRFSSYLDGLIMGFGFVCFFFFGGEGLQNLMCLEMTLTLKFKKKILITADYLALSLHLGKYHSRNSFLLLSFPSFIVKFNWRR